MNYKYPYNNFNIDSNVCFSIRTLDDPYCEFKPELSLKYIKESYNNWHSDRLEIDISVDQAKEIIEFLQSYVNEVDK